MLQEKTPDVTHRQQCFEFYLQPIRSLRSPETPITLISYYFAYAEVWKCNVCCHFLSTYGGICLRAKACSLIVLCSSTPLLITRLFISIQGCLSLQFRQVASKSSPFDNKQCMFPNSRFEATSRVSKIVLKQRYDVISSEGSGGDRENVRYQERACVEVDWGSEQLLTADNVAQSRILSLLGIAPFSVA